MSEDFAKSFYEIKCLRCGVLLTDPFNAVIQQDSNTGGLKGKHEHCPQPEPAPVPVAAVAPEPEPAPEPAAQPGPAPSADYQKGWDDCFASVNKLLGEHFTIPAKETE